MGQIQGNLAVFRFTTKETFTPIAQLGTIIEDNGVQRHRYTLKENGEIAKVLLNQNEPFQLWQKNK